MGSGIKKAVKCKNCNFYYNGAVYSDCPHCHKNVQSSENNTPAPAENRTKDNSIFNGSGLNSEIKDKPVYEQSKKSSNTRAFEAYFFEAEDDASHDIDMAEEKDSSDFDEEIALSQGSDKNDTKKDEISLQDHIQRSGRTIGRFTPSGSESIEPVVGWLVCVKGVYFGESLKLKNGRNRVGRSSDMNVQLVKDMSISRTCVCSIIFDSRSVEFSLLPGESDSLVYLNGSAVYERVILHGYEQIELGDSGENKFIFVPLCGERFCWEDYKE